MIESVKELDHIEQMLDDPRHDLNPSVQHRVGRLVETTRTLLEVARAANQLPVRRGEDMEIEPFTRFSEALAKLPPGLLEDK